MQMKKVYRSSKGEPFFEALSSQRRPSNLVGILEGTAVQASTGAELDCSEQLDDRHFERSR